MDYREFEEKINEIHPKLPYTAKVFMDQINLKVAYETGWYKIILEYIHRYNTARNIEDKLELTGGLKVVSGALAHLENSKEEL